MSYILLARPDRLGEIVLALLPIRIGPGFVMTTVHTDGLCALELLLTRGKTVPFLQTSTTHQAVSLPATPTESGAAS